MKSVSWSSLRGHPKEGILVRSSEEGARGMRTGAEYAHRRGQPVPRGRARGRDTDEITEVDSGHTTRDLGAMKALSLQVGGWKAGETPDRSQFLLRFRDEQLQERVSSVPSCL